MPALVGTDGETQQGPEGWMAFCYHPSGFTRGAIRPPPGAQGEKSGMGENGAAALFSVTSY